MASGPSTDRLNAPVIDPTKNVLDLVASAILRLDDLREVAARQTAQIIALNADHEKELRIAEAARIDAIRGVDVAAVAQQAAAAETRATALAAQVAASAEAMRNQVAAAATAAATSLAAALVPLQEAIADLRRAQYEAQGQKTQIVETRAGLGSANTIISIVLGIVALAAVLFAVTRGNGSSSTPTVVCTATYHPAPCP